MHHKYTTVFSPDVLMALDVDLMEHGVLGLASNVSLHLHGHVAR